MDDGGSRVRLDTSRRLQGRNQPCVEESFQRREGVLARLTASFKCFDNLLQVDRPASDLTQVKAVVWEEAKGLRPGRAGRVEGGSPFLRARGDDAGPVRRLGVAAFIGEPESLGAWPAASGGWILEHQARYHVSTRFAGANEVHRGFDLVRCPFGARSLGGATRCVSVLGQHRPGLLLSRK